MFCENCGSKIEDGSAFCSNCGSPITAPESLHDGQDALSDALQENVRSEVTIEPQDIVSTKSMGKLPIIIAACLAGIVLLVCGVTKDTDTISGVANIQDNNLGKLKENVNKKLQDDVKVSKKMEKEYIERMEAYQEYYEKKHQENRDSIVGARITIGSDNLPLLWLWFSQDEDPDSSDVTQLLTYDEGKVKVLAEIKNVCGCPFISDSAVGAVGFDFDHLYIYDEEKQIFDITELPENDYEYPENRFIVMDILANEAGICTYYIYRDDTEQEISYIGKTRCDVNQLYFSSSEEAAPAVAAESSVSEEESEPAEKKIPYVERTYIEAESIAPGAEFYYADGSKGPLWQAEKELDIFAGSHEGEICTGIGGVEWLIDFDVDTMFRILHDNPVYNSKDLIMLLVAHGLFFEHSDSINYAIVDSVDLQKCTLDEASDDTILYLLSGYIFRGRFDERYMENELYDQLDTEPYMLFRGKRYYGDNGNEWYVEDDGCSDNIVTYKMNDGMEYQFQIELNKAGDKISKISCLTNVDTLTEGYEQDDTTEICHDAMYNICVFLVDNGKLQVESVDRGIAFCTEIADDCVWQVRYSDGSVYDSSYDELYDAWQDTLIGEEYDSPEGLGIEFRNGKVVAVYMTAS